MKYVVVICLVLLGCTEPSPTVSFSANPASVKQGQCATLTWSSTNASKVSIDPGVGKVDPSGSKQVCPGSTTQYTITAAGEGGSEDGIHDGQRDRAGRESHDIPGSSAV